MIRRALGWIDKHSVPGQGIAVSSLNPVSYPEVTGYLVPTLMEFGERERATQYARWLATVQDPRGAICAPGTRDPFAFDTGQVIRGWVAALPVLPELEQPVRRACDWLLESADPATGRLLVPRRGGAWSLGPRGEISEAVHLYCLAPLARAGEALGEKRYVDFAMKSADWYATRFGIPSFRQPNQLTHFFAYVMEGLCELGMHDLARRGMSEVAALQRANGSVPAYSDVGWVCSTGLAQLAQVWFMLGETHRGDRAVKFLPGMQQPGGGFLGSVGPGANYFPREEISWAVKYALEAAQRQIAAYFDATWQIYPEGIHPSDGRLQAILRQLGPLDGKRVLDAGCGKGRFTAWLRERYPTARITALDISDHMLAKVPAGAEKARASILDMPFPDGSFDAVICVEALEHVVPYQQGVRQLCRVLAPGGTVAVIDKNVQFKGVFEMPPWEEWFERTAIEELMRAEGLDATSELTGWDGRPADGLFVCWVGRRAPTG